MQPFHPVAHCGEHALDLMVFSLGQREFEHRIGKCCAGRSTDRFGIIIEHDTMKQALNLAHINRMLGGDLIHLGHVVLGRAHPVNEMAVVGQQQHARRVLVQSTHTLDALDCGLLRALP